MKWPNACVEQHIGSHIEEFFESHRLSLVIVYAIPKYKDMLVRSNVKDTYARVAKHIYKHTHRYTQTSICEKGGLRNAIVS